MLCCTMKLMKFTIFLVAEFRWHPIVVRWWFHLRDAMQVAHTVQQLRVLMAAIHLLIHWHAEDLYVTWTQRWVSPCYGLLWVYLCTGDIFLYTRYHQVHVWESYSHKWMVQACWKYSFLKQFIDRKHRHWRNPVIQMDTWQCTDPFLKTQATSSITIQKWVCLKIGYRQNPMDNW